MSESRMLELVECGQMEELEAAWIQAVEGGAAVAELSGVLTALVAAGQLNMAETLGWELLAERTEQPAGEDALDVARAVVSSVPESDQLRGQAGQAYRDSFGSHIHFDGILGASGLLSGQSPRRAFRTLDTCLAIRDGGFLANRFDNEVIRVVAYDGAAGEFETVDAHGKTGRMEPKQLADEFDVVDDGDFRVLSQHCPEQLRQLLASSPADVLVGICLSAGGQVDANGLKETLVPAHVAAGEWSGWWSRARSAAKRSENLTVSGRPVVVRHHPEGQSLEEELSPAAAAAATTGEHLAVLQQYAREGQSRKLAVDAAFVGPILSALARRAASADGGPADALAAALSIAAAVELGMPSPAEQYPTAEAILASTARPGDVVALVPEAALWPAALNALAARDDASDHLAALLRRTPSALLDEVTSRLREADRAGAIDTAVSEALADPYKHVDICLWLWAGPAKPPDAMPGRAELLRRVLNILREVEKDLEADRDLKREVRQRVRSALSANNYSVYRQAVAEMDEGVAGTVKNLIAGASGLATTVHASLMDILREAFYALFAVARVEPWLDANALWTSQTAMRRREAELKNLVEVKMLENARAIGAAAEHGDISDNSEWQFAIQERDLLRAQAAKIQQELARTRVIEPGSAPADTVGIGSRVGLVRTGDGTRLSADLLGPWDSDVSRHVYNYQTPLAQAMLGKAVGDEVTLKLGGEEALYRIESLGCALEQPERG